MPTLKEYIREAIRRGGAEVGRVVPVTGLSTTTVTAAALADGSPSQAYANWFATRRETATATDRKRIISAFAGSTGVCTIQGANYGDTTTTDEYLELTDLNPYFLEQGVQQTLAQLKRFDAIEFPTYGGVRYDLSDLTWVVDLGDLAGYKVTYRNSPQLTRNRYFEKWNVLDPDTASTTAVPDSWTLAGASGTCARSTTGAVRGKYAAAITRAGTNVTLSQSAGTDTVGSRRSILEAPDGESLAGEGVGFTAKVTTSVASQVRIAIYDGSTTTYSSYHTGGGGMETLTVSATLGATATECTFRIIVEQNGTAYADEAYGYFGQTSDALERDDFSETQVNPRYGSTLPPVLFLPERGYGGQYMVYTKRPYTKFNEVTLMTASDAVSTDAPLTIVAVGALARAYEMAAASAKPGDTRQPRYAQLAADWTKKYEGLARKHLYQEQDEGKRSMIKRSYSIPARRYR